MTQLLVNYSVLMQQPTGISVYARNLLPSLKALHPTLFACDDVEGFKTQKIPSGLSPDFGSKGHLKRLCWVQTQLPRRYCQVNGSLLFSPVPEAPLYSDCRYIVTAHDVIPLKFPQYFSWHLLSYFRCYVKQVMVQAEHIICNSCSTALDISTFYQIPESKITPILLAYDAENFQPCGQPQGNYFLYLGRQDKHKNLTRLIAAFSKVCQREDSVELWLAGPTDIRYVSDLMAQVQSLGIHQRVRFLDYVPYERLPELLGGAIALTFPSLWEGFGLPVLEAMACGTPVITSNLSSLPEVVANAGILIDPYCVDELADAMCLLAGDNQLRSQLSAAGIARAQSFSWEKTGRQTSDVLKRFV